MAYGVEGADDFAICQGRPSEPTSTAAHVAFVADDRRAVDAFYEAALAAGGRSKHAPDLHPEYHAGYYAAFVYDPDGNNIEAVHHGRTDEPSELAAFGRSNSLRRVPRLPLAVSERSPSGTSSPRRG